MISLRLVTVVVLLCALRVHAINIRVDYTYDTNNFFDTPQKQAAMEAVADRYERIIQTNLVGVSPAGTGTGTPPHWRVGFTHPGTGDPFQLSTAPSSALDLVAPLGLADEYGFAGLAVDEWIVFVGGRPLNGAAGRGGTSTGTNIHSTYEDLNGPMHRGFVSNTPGVLTSGRDLPAWGGSLSLATDLVDPWHFDLATPAPPNTIDFYSIALHEVGHALGLNIGFWNQWKQYMSSVKYTGPAVIAAHNADNNANNTFLQVRNATDVHWSNNAFGSFIYEDGDPNLVGTVGLGVLQSPLMDAFADFDASLRRLELTNVDVAALRDLGWTVQLNVIPEPTSLVVIAAPAVALLFRRRCRA